MTIDMKAHEDAVDAYLAKLKTFLMTPDHGDGSWPNITPEQVSEARGLLLDLLGLKWSEDSDGDTPLALRLWFRRTHGMVADWAMLRREPRGEESLDAEEARELENLRTLTAVVSSTHEHLRMVQIALSEVHDRRIRKDAAVDLFMALYVPHGDWKEGPHRHEVPISLHMTEADLIAFQEEARAQGFESARTVAVYATPTRNDAPADGFKAYRDKVEAACGKVGPRYPTLRGELNIDIGRRG
ncbi:hypothetical protein AB4Y45_33885 [Paraburkholderia sp. EG287A]|uniref:hypothetical protein n=1 Tax=Paraburkholderia sp. EG287A TaxID=3237012 RepID=UPI0034D364A6